MEWRGRRQSRNVEDRRRVSGGARAGGVGGVGLLVVVVVAMFLGVDPATLLQGIEGGNPQGQTVELTPEEQAAGEFAAVTLGYTEDIWATIFDQQVEGAYRPVTMVLYRGVTSSPCGSASGATGPFYCPGDKKVYLDTAFFATMQHQLGAGGDFAMAYVVAHEVAHHVQDELGILSQANAVRANASQSRSNEISVMIELQADCYSGIWARQAQAQLGVVQAGDLAEAVNAARQIGDDTLQERAGQVPMPHTFTHGTSDQRARWFERGRKSGQLRDCDTFSADRL